jgi:hypothetical protein
VVVRLGGDFDFGGGGLQSEQGEADEEAVFHAGDCSIGGSGAGARVGFLSCAESVCASEERFGGGREPGSLALLGMTGYAWWTLLLEAVDQVEH